ncbi:MAG TPA: tetratricopeptide repeat protein, partial [Terriglobales bacterium]|nr:tetratricopeptide repeat protein [Terriglobales bacterium]
MRIVTTIFLVVSLSCMLAGENLEKTEKKALETQAKVLISEAKALEKSGKLVQARDKYTESQSLIEIGEATDAIKRLDGEIKSRVKDALNDSRKLYESHKYQEAATKLGEAAELGESQAAVTYNLALCYQQLADAQKAREYLDKARASTADPKQKQRLQQVLTYFVTGENGSGVSETNKEQVNQLNLLTDSVGMEASLEDQLGNEEEAFADSDDFATQPASPVVLKTTPRTESSSHSIASHRKSLCNELDALKSTLAGSPSAVFDRANCAENNGRPTEAAHLLEKYLELSPHALDANDVRVRIAEMQSLVALSGPNAPELRRQYAAAYGYLAERKYDRALTAFNLANKLFPDFPLTYWKLGLLYEATGDVDKSKENFTHYQQLVSEQSAKDEADLHLKTLDAKKTKYDEEVSDAEEILSDLFNRGMNLTFNMDENRRHIRARRAQIKKKQDRAKDKNRVGGFSVPYAYAQQQLSEASEHLQVALALFPLGAEANELMGLVFLQANDGSSAIRSFDAVASQKLPVSFYAEMRGRGLDHAVKCELTNEHIRVIVLSSYDKKERPLPPSSQAGDDGLGDLTLLPSDDRKPFESFELSLSDIHKIETNKGVIFVKQGKNGRQGFILSPIYLP